jgi:hypothetical protein
MQDIIGQIRARGWMDGNRDQLLAELSARRERTQAVAAAKDPRAELIARRQEQVKRLDRKIKSLTTRRRTAARSLAALQRALTKKEAPDGS